MLRAPVELSGYALANPTYVKAAISENVGLPNKKGDLIAGVFFS